MIMAEGAKCGNETEGNNHLVFFVRAANKELMLDVARTTGKYNMAVTEFGLCSTNVTAGCCISFCSRLEPARQARNAGSSTSSLAKSVCEFKYSRNSARILPPEWLGKHLSAKVNGGDGVGLVDDEFLAVIVMGVPWEA
jgi:hypothetical protein